MRWAGFRDLRPPHLSVRATFVPLATGTHRNPLGGPVSPVRLIHQESPLAPIAGTDEFRLSFL